MVVNTNLLMLLLRELESNLACGQIRREDAVPADDNALTMVHEAGVGTSLSPTVDEVRHALKRALEVLAASK